jgi:hypothetical protein
MEGLEVDVAVLVRGDEEERLLFLSLSRRFLVKVPGTSPRRRFPSSIVVCSG